MKSLGRVIFQRSLFGLFQFFVLLSSIEVGLAQITTDDSLLAHYPIHVGNVWDYDGEETFLLNRYPEWTTVTATKDSLHANGNKYMVMERVTYEMLGYESNTYVLSNIVEEIVLQRIDSTSLNVYHILPQESEEKLIDSLRAQQGDLISVESPIPGSVFQLNLSQEKVLDKLRRVRSFYITNIPIGLSFATAMDLGEISFTAFEGDGIIREIAGAVITGDTSGTLLRLNPPGLTIRETGFVFSPENLSYRLDIVNEESGLTIIDSLRTNNDSLFVSRLSYKDISLSSNQQYILIFPNDSVSLDITFVDSSFNGTLEDTIRIYARGLNGESLQRYDIPISIDFTSSVDNSLLPSREIPETFSLEAYPNPLRMGSSLSIIHNLTRLEEISLKIYDILGRTVAILANKRFLAGKYKIAWKPSNISSGTYFVNLTTSQKTKTTRLQIIK